MKWGLVNMEQFMDDETYQGMTRDDIIQILIMRNLNSRISDIYFENLSMEQLIKEFKRN
ncbi:Uncharacterised protein [Lysinibacillus capsici]|uniref:Uncharacterized protein n=1 Tax=Lysinibacillus capsici TaxID=2115968 RepID=A0A2X1BWT6_9BACI|nr:Uncharacterised protein [Lysinibacillus capsici]